MPVYALAQLRIRDRERYLRYARQVPALLVRFGGRLLAADEQPQSVEGSWTPDKVVLLEFASEQAFRAFMDCPEYRAIAGERREASGMESSVLLIRGLAT